MKTLPFGLDPNGRLRNFGIAEIQRKCMLPLGDKSTVAATGFLVFAERAGINPSQGELRCDSKVAGRRLKHRNSETPKMVGVCLVPERFSLWPDCAPTNAAGVPSHGPDSSIRCIDRCLGYSRLR